MTPPYDLTPTIISLLTTISEQLGAVKALHVDKPSPLLRRQSTVRTIHSSLSIEGNTLTEDQITAILENKRVVAPKEDIKEVLNAIEVYKHAASFRPDDMKAFLKAHKMMLDGLMESPGKFRTKGVGIVHGSKVAHVAPPAENPTFLMKDLFSYLKTSKDHVLIKSCVFHYEVEFIHPFTDGNGRMGRLWQSVILSHAYPVFEYLPFETLIKANQDQYYQVLASCDKAGKSTGFIEFMLEMIRLSLSEVLNFSANKLNQVDRLRYFCSLGIKVFTRKDYLSVFKEISTATASRDLLEGVSAGLFSKEGDKRNSVYTLL